MTIDKPAVWVVDDDADDQWLVESAFGELCPAVCVTGLTSFSALLTTLQQPVPLPNLILVDLNMPGISGFEVLHYLHSRAEYAHIPVIVLTTSDALVDQQRAHALGATEFLVKPFTYAEQQTQLAQLIDRWSLVTGE